MRPLRRPLQRLLRRLPPVRQERLPVRRKMPSVRQERLPVRRRMPPVPPSRPPQGQRLSPLPAGQRPPLPRPPSRLLPLRPDKGLTPTPTAREAPRSPGRFAWTPHAPEPDLQSLAAGLENERRAASTAPRHPRSVGGPLAPTRAAPAQRHGTDRRRHGHERRQHGLSRHNQGHDFSKNRPRFATFSAPKRTNIRLFAPSEPRGGAFKRRCKAPTGVHSGQLAAKTARAAAPCEGKSLTNPNRPMPQKRQQRPPTPPTALKAPRALVIIFWKKPPPPRRRPRPIRAVRGARNGVSTRRTFTLVATIPPREVDAQQHERPRRGPAISNRG